MASREIKRKRYEEMKNDLSVELHKLTLNSGNYCSEVHSASEDFEQMMKALNDRHGELLTRSLLIQEQYGTTLEVLEGKKAESTGQASAENMGLPTSNAKDTKKFATDANTSLKGHVAMIKTEFENMERMFQEAEQALKEKMEELKRRTLFLEKESCKMSAVLNTFVRYVVEESDEVSDEDEG